MTSKNTSPFLVETWQIDGWRDGWTITQPYAIGSSRYLLMIMSRGFAGDGNNVHIHAFDDVGRLGRKLFSDKFTEGWTTAHIYKVGNASRLLLLKASGFGSDGNNVHIHRLNANGSVGGRIVSYKWTEGWTTVFTYTVGSGQYLFLLKASGTASDGNNVHIHRINDDGSVGENINSYKWSQGWTSAFAYTTGGGQYLFLLKASGTASDGNNVHIHRLNNDGSVGDRVASDNWTEGWTTAQSFKIGELSYLFLLKSRNGVVHIHHLRDSGHVGQMVCSYDRDPSYTEAFGTGSLATWGPRPWTAGWTNVGFVDLEGSKYLFALKRQLTGNQEKRAKLYRINPMEPVGPMVGHVTRNGAAIWVATVGVPASGVVTFRTDTGPTRQASIVFQGSSDAYYRAGIAQLDGLQEGTRYKYDVVLDGNPFGSGSFTTSPGPNRGKFTAAVASCMDLVDPRDQPAWNTVPGKNPRLLLLVGDNAYPNTTMRSMIWAEHLQQRGIESFANVIRQTPTLATWDDHDFGPNNSAGADVELDHRDESQGAFRELFMGLPFASSQGIHYSFSWGDVDFFVLDNRYFRNHYLAGQTAQRKMLGEDQWDWLVSALSASTARFKVIVSGTTLDSGHTETWADDYPSEWLRLKTVVENYRGIIVVSGDIHVCQFTRHTMPSGRPLWEFTSSGMSGQEGPEHAYMTLSFDTTQAGQESVTARLHRQNGSERQVQTVRLADI